ncbi:MAG: hypothetical protein NZ960_06705 [Candidatus Kapabacteria bacterium]|nr:hypothetical protein [Candidatus Kapabacteria bacterium]MDW8012741.1 FlgD immunoglobulin-like domain containing protein [Bacteroidota bacterium]
MKWFALVRCLLLAAVGIWMVTAEATARRSGMRSATVYSYPGPFNPAGANPRTQPAVSTGYYLVDTQGPEPELWKPQPARDFVSLDQNPQYWRKIVSGPNQFPVTYWEGHPEGKPYFRNPSQMSDSTDNAFAGPIPIGFPFYFNGVRYDSFYVSTNGIIVLSNRRYLYDDGGNRIGVDPNSDDQFVRGTADMTIPDNWGYQYVALGVASGTGAATQGIRNPSNVRLNTATISGMNQYTPLLAPLWDDLQLSVWNPHQQTVDDFGQVWYYRDPTGNRLVIYFINLTPRGSKITPYGTVSFPADIRPGVPNVPFVSCDLQVVLNRLDSSITYIYSRFSGVVTVSGWPVPAEVLFLYNSTVGLRGYARHINFDSKTNVSGALTPYLQFTEFSHEGNPPTIFAVGPTRNVFYNFFAIKWKQWKNVGRVWSVQYKVRRRGPGRTMDFDSTIAAPNNFELLAGDQVLGAIQPVGIFQNLTNDIQGPTGSPTGINYQRQDVQFRVRFQIFNQATGEVVYSRSLAITHQALSDPNSGISLCDVNGNPIPYPPTANGIPPYNFVRVEFPPFEANEFIERHIGRLRAVVILDPVTPEGQSLGDRWPFDDTTSINLFVIRRLEAFNDDVREFHVIDGVPMPSVKKWVSLEADVVSGDEVCYNPPPPRGEYGAANNPNFTLNSPVIRLNRVMLNGDDWPGLPNGDQIISFPIDLRGRIGAVLSVSVQRTGRPAENWYDRGWSDNQNIGPEPRVVLNGIVTNTYGSAPDELRIEFARPSWDGLTNITNITAWNHHPRRGASPVTNNSAFTLFGAGGYNRGFDSLDYNMPLTPAEGLRADLYDDGKDFEFRKIFIPIPDTIIRWPNEGAKNFRFRLWVRAKRDMSSPPPPDDDEDNYYVDNVRILFPTEVTDLEVSAVKVNVPYTMLPASQATRIPISVKISNNTGLAAGGFYVGVVIRREGDPQVIHAMSKYVPLLGGNREVEIPFPDWDARNKGTGPGRYVISARIFIPGGDLEPLNDENYTIFDLRFGNSFAYEADPENLGSSKNNVPDQQFSGIPGRGLNLFCYPQGPTDNVTTRYGPPGGDGSGQLAMRFRLRAQDTVYGYMAFFGSLNQDFNYVSFSLYRGTTIPQTLITGSRISRVRGFGDTLVYEQGRPVWRPMPDGVYDRFSFYILPQPVVLPAGDYWAAVAQRGSVGFELGASRSRMGMVTTNVSTIPTPGIQNYQLMIDKALRIRQGLALINDNVFAFQNTLDGGQWGQFMPTVGPVAYPHLNFAGMVGSYATRSRGTWIPLVRPYLGERAYNTARPVSAQLASFDGMAQRRKNVLLWATASEALLERFILERRTFDAEPWAPIYSERAVGDEQRGESYRYEDLQVQPGVEYQYRLRLVARDGQEQFSHVISLTPLGDGEVWVGQSSPNPFGSQTSVELRLPENSRVRAEVVDALGRLVRVVVDDVLPAGNHLLTWDGTADGGVPAAAGTYRWRIFIGDQHYTQSITLVR